MSTPTATIRVTRTTRDLLAEQAAQRGVSVSALLGEIARQRHVESIWRSEREAKRRDAGDAGVAEEDQAWDVVAEDGID